VKASGAQLLTLPQFEHGRQLELRAVSCRTLSLSRRPKSINGILLPKFSSKFNKIREELPSQEAVHLVCTTVEVLHLFRGPRIGPWMEFGAAAEQQHASNEGKLPFIGSIRLVCHLCKTMRLTTGTET